jgi:hypothetical protein
LDVLLEDFFRHELPEELRDLPPRSRTSLAANSWDLEYLGDSKRNVRNQTGFAPVIGLAAVAVVLLLAVSALWVPSVNRTGQSPERFAGPVGPAAGLQPERSGADELPYEVWPSPLESLVVERYETATGPVEQRTNLRWTNVSVFEPESGTEVEVIIPELSIEIFEIDDEKKEDE